MFTDRAKHSQTAEIMVLRVMQVNLLEWTSKKYFAVSAAEGRPWVSSGLGNLDMNRNGN